MGFDGIIAADAEVLSGLPSRGKIAQIELLLKGVAAGDLLDEHLGREETRATIEDMSVRCWDLHLP